MIQRRSILKTTAAGLLGAPFLNLRAQQPITLRFHTFVPAASNIYSRVHKPWMEKIEKESGGRLRFDAFPSMQMGGAPAQLYDQARDGVADITWTLSGYTPGRFPRTEVFELPFFTYDAESSSRAAWEYYARHAADDFKDVHMLTVHTHGLNILHTRGRPIRSVADFRGLKMRGPTRIATQILTAVGATAIGMPLPQIAEALSKGVIDGAILPWDTVPSARLDELTKFHTEFAPGSPGFNNSVQFMVMNKQRYESLPADLKQLIDANSGLEASGMFGRVIAEKDPVVRKAVIDRGNTVHVMGQAETAEFMRLTSSIDDQWASETSKRGFNGPQLLEAAQALIRKHRARI